MDIKVLVIVPVLGLSMVACKKTPEAQIASIEAQKLTQEARIASQERIREMEIDAAERTERREIDARLASEREQVAHEQEMEDKNNDFWSFVLSILIIACTILLFKMIQGAVKSYIERQRLIKEMRELEIKEEQNTARENFKIGVEEVTKMLPLLSSEERRALFQTGGLLAKDSAPKFNEV